MNDVRASVPLDRNLLGRWAPWVVVLVFAAVCGAVFTASRGTRRDREPADLDPAFVYDVERYKHIPPEQIGYREVDRIATGLGHVTALAAGPDAEIVVAGGQRVLVLDASGVELHRHALPSTAHAVAVSPDGRLLVGLRSSILEGPLAGPLTHLVDIPGERARITSIAVSRDAVFAADAGALAVWRHDRAGLFEGRIGPRDPNRDAPAFVVPSPYFDVCMAEDGLLRIADPGRRSVKAFTTTGELEFSWGHASFALEGFSGCCNPSHIALLPDGRTVTSEKGLPRVKVYDARGRFLTAVVGPDGLDTEHGPCDVAVDRESRVLVLDPGSRTVRILVPRKEFDGHE